MIRHELAAVHSLRYNMSDGLFVEGRCGYCRSTTIDFCPECGIYVCRRCDMTRLWPDVGVGSDGGFAPVYAGYQRRGHR